MSAGEISGLNRYRAREGDVGLGCGFGYGEGHLAGEGDLAGEYEGDCDDQFGMMCDEPPYDMRGWATPGHGYGWGRMLEPSLATYDEMDQRADFGWGGRGGQWAGRRGWGGMHPRHHHHHHHHRPTPPMAQPPMMQDQDGDADMGDEPLPLEAAEAVAAPIAAPVKAVGKFFSHLFGRHHRNPWDNLPPLERARWDRWHGMHPGMAFDQWQNRQHGMRHEGIDMRREGWRHEGRRFR